MRNRDEHPHIATLKTWLAESRIDRRQFLREASLLGLSATAAYAFARGVDGIAAPAQAQAAMPKGGTLRIGLRVQELKNPHAYDWFQSEITRNVCEYLTKTGADNVTRPDLLEKWEASPDLKTWTLHVRRNVKWRKGRDFTADDVIWNLKRLLDPATGSSQLGVMSGYMLDRFDTGQKDDKGQPKMSFRPWDANFIERVDSHTVRLNLKAPQLAVPEHLFNWPAHMMDPEEKGVFEPGANGTGAFVLDEVKVGQKAALKARQGYRGPGPFLDAVEFIDLGDDPSAAIAAMAAKQIHGIREIDVVQLDAIKALPHIQIHEVVSARTGVARMRMDHKPFDDVRVRTAMKLAIDNDKVLQLAYRSLGVAGEHHHVCPAHPEYAKMPAFKQDVARAKRLLAEAGLPNGFETTIACKKDPAWEQAAVEAMVEMWKQIGVKVNVNVQPTAQYFQVWKTVPFGFTPWNHRPLGVMVLTQAYRTGSNNNESGYANPELDKLINEAEGVLDLEKRRALTAKIQDILQKDGPIVQPLWRSNITAFDKRVKGFVAHPSSMMFANELAIEA
jgi:peptide/nickel transport system substrate-binding protein